MKATILKAFLAFFLVLGSIHSFGKNYTISADSDVVTKVDSNGGVVLQITVTNKNAATMSMQWSILKDQFPATGWTYSFCDLNQCFTSGYSNSGTDGMDPKGAGSFTITVNDFKHIAKNARMVLTITDPSDFSAAPDTLVLAIYASRLGVKASILPSVSVNVYPNPASDYLKLNLSNTSGFNPENASIINSLGQSISTQKMQPGTDLINVSTLPNGMYFLRLEDKYGREAMSRFVKE